MVNGTVPHSWRTRFGAAEVLIKPAPPGTGVIAGGGVRAVLEQAGARDVVAKSLGSNNAVNVVRATVKGLMELRDPAAERRRRMEAQAAPTPEIREPRPERRIPREQRENRDRDRDRERPAQAEEQASEAQIETMSPEAEATDTPTEATTASVEATVAPTEVDAETTSASGPSAAAGDEAEVDSTIGPDASGPSAIAETDETDQATAGEGRPPPRDARATEADEDSPPLRGEGPGERFFCTVTTVKRPVKAGRCATIVLCVPSTSTTTCRPN
jgi:hypothetical protein